VDARSGRVLQRIPLPATAKPMGLALSPDGSRLFVATGRGATVEVIDTRTNGIIGSVPVGRRPWGIALTGDGRKLYVANGPSNDVSVIDTQSLRVTRTIPVGSLPWGVAIGPAP
jgi:YVTN family beta-propeller protein